jgi:glutamate dehydrogenase
VLNRADDAIPTKDELLSSPHRGRGLPRPLLAVLLGHTKMYAFEMVMQTSFPESEAGRPFLVEYFPQRLQREFAEHFGEHPLRREIVATAAVNHVINCAGVTLLSRMMAGGKFGIGDVIAAYSEVDRFSGALALRERLKDAPPETAHKGLLELEDALESATRDALEGRSGDTGAALEPVRARLEPA